MNGQKLAEQFPGGCYIGFNAPMDRKSAEQVILVCGQAVNNGYNTVTLCISSVGGALDQAYYLVNMLDAFPVRFVSYNVGQIQSAANLMFLCADKRYAVPGSTFFFHQTWFDPPPGQPVNEAYITEKLKAIHDHDARCAAVYQDKTGQAPEAVREWCNRELLMTGDMAVKNGIIHEVRRLGIPANAFFHQIVV